MVKPRTARSELTPELVRTLIEYDPKTGLLTWRRRGIEFFSDDKGLQERAMNAWNSRLAGKPALSSPSVSGHLNGSIFCIGVLAHRAAWAIHYGFWPSQFIDHINGIKTDNRIENLRDVSFATNTRNAKRRKDNKSGYSGVYKHKNRYIAHIRINGKLEVIGRFDSALDAHNFREIEKLKYGYHPNHGRE